MRLQPGLRCGDKMIEINLLPEELRQKAKKPVSNESVKVIPSQVFLVIPGILVLIIIVQIILGVLSIFKSTQLGMLKRQWGIMDVERKQWEELKSGTAQRSLEDKIINQLSSKSLLWAPKLNKLSLLLPGGIWFQELTYSQVGLNLQASVISLQKDEMALINKFMKQLKDDKDFMQGFSGLELSTVSKRKVGGYDVTDFTLSVMIPGMEKKR